MGDSFPPSPNHPVLATFCYQIQNPSLTLLMGLKCCKTFQRYNILLQNLFMFYLLINHIWSRCQYVAKVTHTKCLLIWNCLIIKEIKKYFYTPSKVFLKVYLNEWDFLLKTKHLNAQFVVNFTGQCEKKKYQS